MQSFRVRRWVTQLYAGSRVSAMDNEALVRRAIDAIWNRGELDVADELFGHDYVSHDDLIPDLIHGPEAIKISVVLYRIAFPDLCITVEELSADGEAVVIHWTARRNTPGSAGGAVNADQTLLTGTTRSRWCAGKIAESWTEWSTPKCESGLISK